MSQRSGESTAPITVALLGNPNTGKTAVFNRLTGLSQKVGNYPGVTVERKEGPCVADGIRLRLLDLPGTYSLAPHSPDEAVAVEVLLGRQEGEERPRLVVQVVDASNLERNLYLLSQVLETGVPVVVALNMMDVAQARGIVIDVPLLSARLGVPVVPVEGHRGAGIDALRKALAEAARKVVARNGAGTSEGARQGGAAKDAATNGAAASETAGQEAARNEAATAVGCDSSGSRPAATVSPASVPAASAVPAASVGGTTSRSEFSSALVPAPVPAPRPASGPGPGPASVPAPAPGPEGPLPIEILRLQLDAFRKEIKPALERAGAGELEPTEALRALIDRGGHAEARLVALLGDSVRPAIERARASVTVCMPLAAFEAGHRYAWVHARTEGCVRRTTGRGVPWSERVDRLLTHRLGGYAIFGLLMLAVFQAIFAGARPLMGWIEAGFAELALLVEGTLSQGALRSLLADGVVAGVGMVAMFLPQILILFLFIGILEDCGYMARGAFLMDKIMSKVGLSGKSFVPMLSGFACAVPGILAARVIEDRRDRLATMLVTPLLSCSARLPIYSVFIGTFVPAYPIIPGVLDLQGLTLFGLYLLGIVVAVAVAWVLRRTLLRGARPPFVLELPSYKCPSAVGLALRLKGRAREFLLRAGTVILAIAVVVWALAYFPRSPEIGARFAAERARLAERAQPAEGAQMAERARPAEAASVNGGRKDAARAAAVARLDAEEASAYLADSYFGRLGRAVEPAFAPLGWDWRISVAVLASFPAREVFVSTLGTIFQMGSHTGEDGGAASSPLRDGLRRATRLEPGADPDTGAIAPAQPAQAMPPFGPAPLFSLPVALSVLVFFALCCQCGATVATLGREARSALWALFGFGYMTGLAYAGALVTFQVARWLGG